MTPFDLVVRPSGATFMGQHFPCTVGRGGVSNTKVEGDGATPRGTHYIQGAYFRPDRITAPSTWAVPIGPRDLWCDASGHPEYNHLVQAPFASSHEVMRRADPMYDLVLITDWNWPDAKPGLGSAIFIHQWRRPQFPTAGCIGLHRLDLHWIASKVQIGSRLIVV